jgi:carboxymethylenebutenolidase
MAVTSEVLSGEYVSINGANGFVCRPRQITEAGMLLLPHVDGIHAEMRHEAAAFAGLGYATFVWDPYPGINAEAMERDTLPKLNDDATTAEQQRCLDYLFDTLGVKRVGALGWCMGGRMGLVLAAREPRLDVCVSYYPSMREERRAGEADAALEAANIQCPLQVMYPANDHVTSNATFRRYRDALDGCKQPTSVNVFPGAEHGFLSEGRQAASEANRRATQLAWPQTLALLQAVLQPAGNH